MLLVVLCVRIVISVTQFVPDTEFCYSISVNKKMVKVSMCLLRFLLVFVYAEAVVSCFNNSCSDLFNNFYVIIFVIYTVFHKKQPGT